MPDSGTVSGSFQGVHGVPRSSENAFPWDPTVGLCLGPYDGPRGGGRFIMGEVPRYSRRRKHTVTRVVLGTEDKFTLGP